jgi:hypothetical protein
MRTEIEAINRELRMATDGEFELPPIDALATLQPQILARIIREAITPFYDSSLDRRVYEAREEWEERYPGTGDRCDALWQAIRRFRAKPDKKIVDGQAASPSSWKTPFIAT